MWSSCLSSHLPFHQYVVPRAKALASGLLTARTKAWSAWIRGPGHCRVGLVGCLGLQAGITTAAAFSRQRPRSGAAPQRRSSAPAPAAGRDKLDRFLSKAGALSRGEARVQVKNGNITVNGLQVFDPWHIVQPGLDRVEIVGVGPVELPDWAKRPPSVVLYNKPPDVVCTLNRNDPLLNGKDSLCTALPVPFRDRLAPHVPALRPVGRLDAPTVGLLLLTDSSQLGSRLTDPGVCLKEYLVSVEPAASAGVLEKLRSGVHISDGNFERGPTKECDVDVVRRHKDRDAAVLKFRLQEGRNRQIRKMCAAVGLRVEWLIRVRVGPLELGELGLGKAREATDEERTALLQLAGIL